MGLAAASVAACSGGSDDPVSQLCDVAAISTDWQPRASTVEEMITSDDEDALLAATVIAVASTTRPSDFEHLGPYDDAVQAVIRRGRANLVAIGAETDGRETVPVPDASEAEVDSARAADRVIADGGCAGK